MSTQADYARLAETPWRGKSITGSAGDGFADNPTTASPAPKKLKGRRNLSILERECGISHEQFEAFMAEQRAQVRSKYGIAS